MMIQNGPAIRTKRTIARRVELGDVETCGIAPRRRDGRVSPAGDHRQTKQKLPDGRLLARFAHLTWRRSLLYRHWGFDWVQIEEGDSYFS